MINDNNIEVFDFFDEEGEFFDFQPQGENSLPSHFLYLRENLYMP